MVALCDLFNLAPLKHPQLDHYLSARSDPWLNWNAFGCRLQQWFRIGKQRGRWSASSHWMSSIMSWWPCVTCSNWRHWNNHSLIITCQQETTHGLIESPLNVGYSDGLWLANREVVEARQLIEWVALCHDGLVWLVRTAATETTTAWSLLVGEKWPMA
jgi:hypothetical protein